MSKQLAAFIVIPFGRMKSLPLVEKQHHTITEGLCLMSFLCTDGVRDVYQKVLEQPFLETIKMWTRH